ncbi:MAG TPA: hypothetical protein VIV06_11870 [Candidatus Limnocylindrales bacterium]
MPTKSIDIREGSRLDGLAAEYAKARTALDQALDALKPVRAAHDEAERALFDAMENQGLASIRTHLGLFRVDDLADAKVEDEGAARAWAEQAMPELLLLNRQRLSALVRRILRGEEDVPKELPPGVTFATRQGITWRRTL